MNMNISNNLNNINNQKEGKFDVFDFIRELTERLRLMEKVLVIDRFEDNYAVCEDRNTKEICNIEKQLLPENVKEGSILKYENGKYVLDKEIEEDIENRIKDKMNNIFE